MRTQQTRSSSDSMPTSSTEHQPVLLQEIINLLEVSADETVFDGTLGGAGHAYALASKLGKEGTFVGTDVDSRAIAKTRDALVAMDAKVVLAHTNFKNIKKVCKENGITSLNKALLDLGWSSDQINPLCGGGLGLSFLKDEPLNMRLSNAETLSMPGGETDVPTHLTAGEIVNEWGQESIADILYGWGGERYSQRIAKAIVEARKDTEIKTTFELAKIIKKATPKSYSCGRLHSATRTFQALRIAVNDEIRVLQSALQEIKDLLSSGGRLAVISFHSGEDRVVKRTFKKWKEEGGGKILNKKPIVPSQNEVRANPRARSAKLRIFQKT